MQHLQTSACRLLTHVRCRRPVWLLLGELPAHLWQGSASRVPARCPLLMALLPLHSCRQQRMWRPSLRRVRRRRLQPLTLAADPGLLQTQWPTRQVLGMLALQGRVGRAG